MCLRVGDNREWFVVLLFVLSELTLGYGPGIFHGWPVLKHGPRSLAYMRAFGFDAPVRSENECQEASRALTANHNPCERGLSRSIYAETRKMVNYA